MSAWPGNVIGTALRGRRNYGYHGGIAEAIKIPDLRGITVELRWAITVTVHLIYLMHSIRLPSGPQSRPASHLIIPADRRGAFAKPVAHAQR